MHFIENFSKNPRFYRVGQCHPLATVRNQKRRLLSSNEKVEWKHTRTPEAKLTFLKGRSARMLLLSRRRWQSSRRCLGHQSHPFRLFDHHKTLCFVQSCLVAQCMYPCLFQRVGVNSKRCSSAVERNEKKKIIFMDGCTCHLCHWRRTA